MEKLNSTSQASRTLEASALSALLVPGGQVPIAVPSNNLRSVGRSTITKVSSPFVNASESNRNLSLESRYSKKINDSQTAVSNDSDKFNDDNAFNWYFQHYNDSHLDPYLGDVYSGVDNFFINQWTFFGTQIIVALWSFPRIQLIS